MLNIYWLISLTKKKRYIKISFSICFGSWVLYCIQLSVLLLNDMRKRMMTKYSKYYHTMKMNYFLFGINNL